MNNKITPSLPLNDVSLHFDDSGRSARTAKDEMSSALAIAAQDRQHDIKHMIRTELKSIAAPLTVANKKKWKSFKLLRKIKFGRLGHCNFKDYAMKSTESVTKSRHRSLELQHH